MAVKRPTILQIIPELETGGAELSTVEIADATVRAGGRAIVLSEGGRLAPRISAHGGEFIPFPAATKNPFRIIWNAATIAKLVRDEDVDLIHARSRAPAWSALMAARMTGKPFVTTYHGAYNEKGKIKRAYNSVMARGDLVIANSRYTANLIQSRYGTATERLRVIYRGVDGQRFAADAVEPSRIEALRQRWAVPPEARIVLHPARLTAWKGQSTVIAAARLLKAQGRLAGAMIILAGDAQGRDDYTLRLKREVADAGLEGQVRLVGHVDDMPAAFATAYVSLVASIEPEAFGRTATEAQALGCPVIATDIGAPPETVLAPPRVPPEERTGWLVPPANAEALADAMTEALALSPEIRAELGSRARSHVVTAFSLDAMRRQTLGTYDELLGTTLATDIN